MFTGEFEYGYEYMGLTNSLVITPLTERVFLGLTQALQYHFSAAITGIIFKFHSTEMNNLIVKLFSFLYLFIDFSYGSMPGVMTGWLHYCNKYTIRLK